MKAENRDAGKWTTARRLMAVLLILPAVFAGGTGMARQIEKNGVNRSYEFESDAREGGYELPELAIREQMEQIGQEYIGININARPETDKESGKCNLMIGNPADNQYDMKISVFMEDSGEMIYQSEPLRPGERKPYVYLEFMPDAGSHELTAVFSVLGDDGSIIGEIEAALLLNVIT